MADMRGALAGLARPGRASAYGRVSFEVGIAVPIASRPAPVDTPAPRLPGFEDEAPSER